MLGEICLKDMHPDLWRCIFEKIQRLFQTIHHNYNYTISLIAIMLLLNLLPLSGPLHLILEDLWVVTGPVARES